MAKEEQTTDLEQEDQTVESESQEEEATEEEAPELKNIVTVEEAGPCKKKVIIEIPEAKIKKVIDEQYEELRREAVVPGFRKGRAPRRLLEKRFGKETSEQVKLKLLADASQAVTQDADLKALGEPDIDFEEIKLPEEGPLTFDFEIEVRPEFELPPLEGISVSKTTLEVTDEQVDREIEQMRRWAGVWMPRAEGAAVEREDQIIADVTLKVEGVDEEQKLDNIEIHVRPSGFVGAVPVEKLDELLVGAKTGEHRETSIEVPKTFFREEYRGKKVDVHIDIEDIKWLKPADLDEAFLQRYQAEDVNELREKIQDALHSQLETRTRSEMTDQIYQYLLDKTDFDLPLDIVAEQAHTVLQRQYTNLMMRGLSREQIAEQFKQLQSSSEEQAKRQLKTFFIMDKVAEKLDIDVTEEEINGHIAQLAAQRGQRPERMREEMARDGSLAQFSLEVRQEKCIAKLLETAKITEKKAKTKAKKAKAQKESTKTRKKAAKPEEGDS
ncbi:MAG: trigger factor [Sedimentisphaerales bacterium]